MGFCTNCGKQIDEDSTFCRYCGGKIETGQAVSPVNASGDWGAAIPQAPNRIKKPVVIGIVAVLVVVIAFGIYHLLGGGAKPEVGDIIEFGGYEWRVLEVRDGKALILSDEVLDLRKYNDDYSEVTWESCDLRRYLNSDFYNSFKKTEQKRIKESRITNSDNPYYGTIGGRDTDDKVFLLSLDEVVKYFGDSGQLRSGSSYIDDQYNSARRAYIRKDWNGWAELGATREDWEEFLEEHKGTSLWCLRSPGSDSDFAAYVDFDGSVDVDGDDDIGGVRPALWLNL